MLSWNVFWSVTLQENCCSTFTFEHNFNVDSLIMCWMGTTHHLHILPSLFIIKNNYGDIWSITVLLQMLFMAVYIFNVSFFLYKKIIHSKIKVSKEIELNKLKMKKSLEKKEKYFWHFSCYASLRVTPAGNLYPINAAITSFLQSAVQFFNYP